MRKGETGQLRLLTGLVLFLAAGCVTWAATHLVAPSPAEWLYLVIAVGLVIVATACSAPVQIRSQMRFTATSAAVLVLAVILPPAWAILCAATGVTAGRLAARHAGVSFHKALHNSGKDVLAATAASYAAWLAGVRPGVEGELLTQGWVTYVVALSLAAAAFAAVEEIVMPATLVLATGRSWGQIWRTDWDVRLAVNLASILLAGAALGLLALDPRLMIAIPLAQLVLYLLYMHRLHLRAERTTWEQLAAATDALNGVDLTGVLHTAARGAVAVFNARQAQVELWDVEPCRLVRADATRVLYDGPSSQAPPPAELTASRFLGGRDGSAIGVLRLALPATTGGIHGREESTLRAFGASLTTAILNARAYAELTEERDRHAEDARHDPLTGLANRRALLDRLGAAPEQPASGTRALALVDLNRFKEVNDTLGHAFGDQLLVELGGRLHAAADENGAVVARLGGDEFAIVLDNLPAPATAIHRARRILDCLRDPVALAGMQVTVQASAGIALAGPGVAAGELLRRADVAMYQAKRAGVSIVDYQHGRDTADHRQLSLGGELARAVEEGEFTVRFQPIVDLGSGEAVAAEALTRWQHPRHGVLLPKQWLPIVERSDLLGAFTARVLRQALLGLREWKAAGFDLTVALNVSPHSLLDPAFPAMVLDELRARRLDPGSLMLELAETTSVGQLQAVERVLTTLRSAGVRLALDDFGTGHSSLSVVSEVAVHELKIDRTFVAAMRTSAQAAAAVRSTVELGRSLGLALVAEGVETADQRQALWELGCTAGQGHLFGRPMKAGELLEALRDGADGVRGSLAASLHPGATVIALRNRPPA
ncbi:bifunctional diguanylate cyclase/phosphodiesterase [Phytohabitans sp. ZYX-F-186]|uniref:Bifunctional diguanylate cyclase/phosphodiesterase n=1 Tax=Phytohabitans maris TaxID=3071409 RepID=A0ABU0ZQG6_9ACTN|nr:bifunctional diguanylate cyclase/phosphodiesterase [Phytohabitans sp. ZYX-F-186]MDQ7908589.1 bifunctional diguanylate cyclase/phosphodiesterase [Phytohabitans sp. ZYX-F-186]